MPNYTCMLQEFDFLREARLMRVIAARLAGAGVRGLVIPEPLLALSTPRMLVMQRMPGAGPLLSLGHFCSVLSLTSWLHC